jgi:hypothetical protein
MPPDRPRPEAPHSQRMPVPALDISSDSKWQGVQARWEALRPTVAAYWPRLPTDEVQRLSGDRASLVQLVKRHYAVQDSGAESQVDAWLTGALPESQENDLLPPPARTKDEQRAEGEGMAAAPGAFTASE